jgi:hypothetical protein
LKFACSQRTGLAAVLEFIKSSPELKRNKITDDEDKNKKRRIYSSASIAANPMLGAWLI